MKLKFFVAGLLAAVSFGASAGDQVLGATADGITRNFFAELGDGILSGNHDIISLAGLGAGTYNIGITVSGQQLVFNENLSNLNGVTGAAFNYNGLSFYGVKFSGSGPFILDLVGTVTGAGANYAGTYTVTSAVPEPETYGMLLAGLGLVGFAARRKAKKAA